MSKVYHRSQSDEWETPPELFALLDREYHFTLDVCATPENAKCERYFTVDDNGLLQSWAGEICWMNPPYSNISNFMFYAHEQAYRNGATVVCLVPARVDTRWWWNYCTPAESIRFLKGRLKFVGADSSAPFPSAIVTLDKDSTPLTKTVVRNPHRTIWWNWKKEYQILEAQHDITNGN
ncbi:MAG: adenine methyltransferase [candidate division Zixibacteria bacterium]|nr:adenine methyltransferase [Gammaproteobacteria bacterium]NIR25704.1 adenine methyltransferase [Gammaproteobacteria bacterium]NIR65297.1 adenine methyltransferase [candidate division Zixibacteria bacterium]NIS52341.1 adenine methyltransferase [Phycisphaerae bacterium]NIX02140.1 adenine methyltransferase [Phycisphaerae bacterium]